MKKHSNEMKTIIQLVIKTREKERYVRSAWGVVWPFLCHMNKTVHLGQN